MFSEIGHEGREIKVSGKDCIIVNFRGFEAVVVKEDYDSHFGWPKAWYEVMMAATLASEVNHPSAETLIQEAITFLGKNSEETVRALVQDMVNKMKAVRL